MRGIYRHMAVVAVILAAVTAAGPVFSKSRVVEVTYVANEGFLIAAGPQKILVDALFSEGFETYLTPSRSTRDKLEEASAPFDGVDLILVTHMHDDHFNPQMVVRHLESNTGAVCVAPQQAVDKLRALEQFPTVAARVKEITPGYGEVIAVEVGGIELGVFGMRHAPYMENGVDRHRNTQNVGFSMTLGGVHLFHPGDAVMDLDGGFIEATAIGDEPIDILFIKAFDMSENTQHLVKEVFKPKHVIGMHVRPQDVEKMAGIFPKVFQGGFVFKGSMEKRTLPVLRDCEAAD